MKSNELAKILSEYPDAIDDRRKLISLLRDCFPCEKSLINLLADAYDIGIVSDIKSNEIDELLVNKSQKKMTEES